MNDAAPAHAQFEIVFATEDLCCYAGEIAALIEQIASEPGSALALRAEQYVAAKIKEGKAVIAFAPRRRQVIGFCYIETWEDQRYVANSGLVVAPAWRKFGLGRLIKQQVFELSRRKYPSSKLFGLTTSPAVMKINSELGYRAASFAELTNDDQFWQGCSTCPYHDILLRLKRRVCLCTGMVFDPAEQEATRKDGFVQIKKRGSDERKK